MYIYWNEYRGRFIATSDNNYASYSNYNNDATWDGDRLVNDEIQFQEGIAIIQADGSLKMTN